MKILVTGSAGFIGFHLVKKLAELGYSIIGIDNINDYYDVKLKYARLKESGINENEIQYDKKVKSPLFNNYEFIKLDLTDYDSLLSLFKNEQFDVICNLAAQAGVRYSLENPKSYIDSNILGFFNILESCRRYPVKHLVYASSSSVYGMNEKTPFSPEDRTDNPISLYAATKKSNELMAHSYSHLYNISATSLRFFTVYGPYGRPDMAYYKFAKAIMNDQPIHVYNNGDMLRDFTYIDDIVTGIISSIVKIPVNTPKHVIYNLGNNRPVKLLDFINILEQALEKSAKKEFLGMQAGDVHVTAADIESARKELGWQPETNIKEGLDKFVKWFTEYNV